MYEFRLFCYADFCAAMLAHLTNVYFHGEYADQDKHELVVKTDDLDTMMKIIDYVTEKAREHYYANGRIVARSVATFVKENSLHAHA